MILIINTCKEKLSELEFVKPIENIVKKFVTKHYSEVTEQELTSADKIILTGTALKDFAYLRGDFTWLKTVNKPVLGICAGMQIIAKTFGMHLKDITTIGVRKVSTIIKNKLCDGTFNAYFLHTKTTGEGFIVLAASEGIPCVVKHPDKEIYGCIFHPEVMNEEIIKRFVDS